MDYNGLQPYEQLIINFDDLPTYQMLPKAKIR